MEGLTEEAGCLSHKGAVRHSLPESLSILPQREKTAKLKSSHTKMLDFFLGANILLVSPHLLLWQYLHTLFFPIHGPATHCSLCFSLELTALPPSPRPCTTSYHELPKWPPPNTVPLCITCLQAAIYPSFSLFNLIPIRLFAQAPHLQFLCPNLIAAVTPQHNPIRERLLSLPALRATNCSQGPAAWPALHTHTGWDYALQRQNQKHELKIIYQQKRLQWKCANCNFSNAYNLPKFAWERQKVHPVTKAHLLSANIETLL